MITLVQLSGKGVSSAFLNIATKKDAAHGQRRNSMGTNPCQSHASSKLNRNEFGMWNTTNCMFVTVCYVVKSTVIVMNLSYGHP